jgi:hypothetical protein
LGEGGYQKEKYCPLTQSPEREGAKKLREVGSLRPNGAEGRCEIIKKFGSPRPNGERGWGVRGSA